MIILQTAPSGVPRKLPATGALPKNDALLPVTAGPQWSRRVFSLSGGLLGEAAAKAEAEKLQVALDAVQELTCDSYEYLTRDSAGSFRLATSFGTGANKSSVAAFTKLDPKTPSGAQLLDSFGKLVVACGGDDPVAGSVSIAVALTSTFVRYGQEEIDLGGASAEVLSSALDAARIIAVASGYPNVATGLASAVFIVKAGKNVSILRKASP